MLQRELARFEILLNPLSVPQRGRGQQEGIDAVEDTPVAGEQGARILYPGAPLDGGLDQITDLGKEIQHYGQDQPVGQRARKVEGAIGPADATSAAAMSRLPASEAALPSQVFCGLIRGASFLRPKLRPT